MTAQIETTTVTIEAGFFPEAKAKLEKLAKKAERFGLDRPTWHVGEPYTKTRILKSGRKVDVKVVDLTVSNTVVKVQGVELVAAMERTDSGNFLRVREGFDLPEHFRHSHGYCDHCKTTRDRKDVYVFRTDAGEFVQIGSTCLKDYLGKSPAAIAFASRFIDDLRGMESESWGEFAGGRRVESTLHIMAIAHVVIRDKGGYVSRAAAESNSTTSTAALVEAVLWPKVTVNATRQQREFAEWVRRMNDEALTEEAMTVAKEARDWLLNEWKDGGNYAHNVRLVLKEELFTSWKMLAVAVSAMPTYLREQDKLVEMEIKAKAAEAKREEAAKVAQHIGAVGERLKDIEATVMGKHFCYSGDFADVFVIKFEDRAGNQFSWFTTGKPFKVGDEVILTGTVKKHDEFRGVKQNVLTRCKVEVVKEREAA